MLVLCGSIMFVLCSQVSQSVQDCHIYYIECFQFELLTFIDLKPTYKTHHFNLPLHHIRLQYRNKPFSKHGEDRLLSVSKKPSPWILIQPDLVFLWNPCLTWCCLEIYIDYNLEQLCYMRKQSIFIFPFFLFYYND